MDLIQVGEEGYWTKTSVPLELLITPQLAAVLDRRWAESGEMPGFVFPSPTIRTG
ncbi:MAG: hypothetical protein OXL38_17530 [Gammaproteobacteria bacterium]|nr:hypothetical protein [Gammaproteobacteria bacterium]